MKILFLPAAFGFKQLIPSTIEFLSVVSEMKFATEEQTQNLACFHSRRTLYAKKA